jgi:radical SAM superfamily enzyme YgiQ (UPF0313 family)
MPALKALTPKDWDVRIVDELVSDVDLDAPCDVVGIGAMGPQISRAYELADAFRARGKKVVLGGPWVSLAPHERSLEHADAIVVGEAETGWPRAAEAIRRSTTGSRRPSGRRSPAGPGSSTTRRSPTSGATRPSRAS